MLNEEAFISEVEAARTADELAEFFRRPTRDEEKALRTYFGEMRYQRLHAMALRRGAERTLRQPLGNVVVLHGIMGSDLSSFTRSGAGEHVWVQALKIMRGALDRLQLDESGRRELNREFDVRPTGIMKRHYGELLLSLSDLRTVRAFWYDWRKDLNVAADELAAHISGWFDDRAPVHLVAHSMGGLVARTFIKNHPRRWDSMFDREGNGRAGGRLIMLGTPNHGSFAIPQVITGIEPMVRKVALLDLRHDVEELLPIFNSFVGLYQMLPSPLAVDGVDALYQAETFGRLGVPALHLRNALAHHRLLAGVVDPDRMVYIAGANQPTFSGIKDMTKLREARAYDVTLAGDGRVPHALGVLKTADGSTAVRTYYVEEQHGDLAVNGLVLDALRELLERGTSEHLPEKPPAPTRALLDGGDPREQLEAAQRNELEEVERVVFGMGTRSRDERRTAYVSYQERELEDAVTRGFLSSSDEQRVPAATRVEWDAPRIELGLVCAGIEAVHEIGMEGPPVDAVAVGHYLGVKPQEAERALDEAISRTLLGSAASNRSEIAEADLLLTQYTERGIIRGELGQPFLLADPRSNGAGGDTGGRVIAIAGMGLPGRFGVPELTVLARELCWALGRLGKQHLASVVIGAGNGNLDVRDAVDAWIRGAKNAVTGSSEDERRRLLRITFVERDARKLTDIQETILAAKRRLDGRLKIDYAELSAETLRALEKDADRAAARLRRRDAQGPRPGRTRTPTRLTLELDGSTYRFGAITEHASVPERTIPLDPKLVEQANDELAGEWRPRLQHERGQLLERLLVPDELRPHLASDAPLVMLLDSTTARIHWEMLAAVDASAPVGGGAPADDSDLAGAFIATSRGFTRQLRTTFAPPPEPPPPPRRLLRVLVVADPAEDAHLPGAEEEGVVVADLFEAFNSVYESAESRIEVVRLFGPREATRTAVLRHLILRSYDVLHYAGHCVYDPLDPSRQGWLFTGGELLSPNELNRIDRIPKFVFSNACESGITPDRSEERSVDLAPSFAESFFQRGVSNFVCTAWPVNDIASRDFALTVYGGLLGLVRADGNLGGYTRARPKTMHVAMREARQKIFGTLDGARTWGAYQHYGNPYFHLFDAETLEKSDASRAAGQPRRRQARRRPRGSSSRAS